MTISPGMKKSPWIVRSHLVSLVVFLLRPTYELVRRVELMRLADALGFKVRSRDFFGPLRFNDCAERVEGDQDAG